MENKKFKNFINLQIIAEFGYTDTQLIFNDEKLLHRLINISTIYQIKPGIPEYFEKNEFDKIKNHLKIIEEDYFCIIYRFPLPKIRANLIVSGGYASLLNEIVIYD